MVDGFLMAFLMRFFVGHSFVNKYEEKKSIRIKLIKNVIKKYEGNILDIGCFQGALHIELLKIKDVLGIDIKIKKCPFFINASADKLPFRKSIFKIIIAGELIEHLKNPNVFLKECSIILKNSGILILTTPNKDSWWNKITKSYYLSPEHINLINEKEIIYLLKKEGFSIKLIKYLPFDRYTFELGFYLMFSIRKLIHKVIPNNLRENMVIVSKLFK